jgi:hypothetical protein
MRDGSTGIITGKVKQVKSVEQNIARRFDPLAGC